MPAWAARYPGVEEMHVAVMGCVVNGPGESKHADIGISLPGTFEEPVAPVFVDGALRTTLRGEGLVDEFITILDDYVERRYGAACHRSPPDGAQPTPRQRGSSEDARARRGPPASGLLAGRRPSPAVTATISRRRAGAPAHPGQPGLGGPEPDGAGPDASTRPPSRRSRHSSMTRSGKADQQLADERAASQARIDELDRSLSSIQRSLGSDTQYFDVSKLVVDPADVGSLPATSTFFPDDRFYALDVAQSTGLDLPGDRPSCS